MESVKKALQRPLPLPVVLLVFPFSQPQNLGGKSASSVAAEGLKRSVGSSVQVTKVDTNAQPEIIRTFNVQQLPAFLLFNQGLEIWRHEGSLDEQLLSQLIQQKVNSLTSALNQPPYAP